MGTLAVSVRANPAEVSRIAHTAFDLAKRYDTPPSPPAYEVWYTYASRSNQRLNDAVDGLLETNGTVTPAEIIRLHEEHCSNLEVHRDLTNAGDEIEEVLDAVVKALCDCASDSSGFDASLRAISSKIAQTNDPSILQRLADRMVTLNVDRVKTTKQLGDAFLEAQRDLARVRAELRQMKENLLLDHLTRLGNRRHFDSTLAKEFELARESGEPLSLAIADLDHFKLINDTFGHAVGDKVLTKFSEILRNNLNSRDAASRIGGEEFAIIFPRTSINAAINTCNIIRDYARAMRPFNKTSGAKIRKVTASFGVTALRDSDDLIRFMARADKFLYSAKEAGRDTVSSDTRASYDDGAAEQLLGTS